MQPCGAGSQHMQLLGHTSSSPGNGEIPGAHTRHCQGSLGAGEQLPAAPGLLWAKGSSGPTKDSIPWFSASISTSNAPSHGLLYEWWHELSGRRVAFAIRCHLRSTSGEGHCDPGLLQGLSLPSTVAILVSYLLIQSPPLTTRAPPAGQDLESKSLQNRMGIPWFPWEQRRGSKITCSPDLLESKKSRASLCQAEIMHAKGQPKLLWISLKLPLLWPALKLQEELCIGKYEISMHLCTHKHIYTQ